MSKEIEEDEIQASSPLRDIMRNITYIFGLFILLWLLLAKNLPTYFAPNSNSQAAKSNTAPPKPEHAPNVIDTRIEEPKPATPAPAPEPERFAAPVTAQPVITPEPAVQQVIVSEAEREHIKHLEEQVTRLSSELDTVKKQLVERNESVKNATQAWDEKLQAHEKLMDGLKAQLEELQSNGAHQVTAITEFSIMKEAASHGEPFESEHRQMVALIHDPAQSALLALLQPFAHSGIPTFTMLQNQFEKLMQNAFAPASKGNSFASNLKSLIRIRKEGEHQQGLDDESVLARAEAKLQRGEIAAALKEMQSLSPPTADVFSQWMRDAKNTIEARNSLDALQIAILKNPSPAAPKEAKKEIPKIVKVPADKVIEPMADKPQTATDNTEKSTLESDKIEEILEELDPEMDSTSTLDKDSE